jgi:hypothetical protein
VLGEVQTTLRGLEAGCQTAVTQLAELQSAAERTQQELADANTRLNDVVRAQQEAKVTVLIQTLQGAIRDTTATWEKFDQIQKDKLAGHDVRERFELAVGAFQGMQICEDALIQINGFGEGVDSRYTDIIEQLRKRVQPVLARQCDLKQRIKAISAALSLEYQQAEQQHRLDGQRQLALEDAAVPAAAVASRSSRQVQSIQPLLVQNYFGGPGRTLSLLGKQLVMPAAIASDDVD